MEQEPENESQSQDQLVNYMPGMPTLSGEPGRIERFITRFTRRRGSLRPASSDEGTVVTNSR